MQRPRTPSKLSESLHQRLNSYALAASAAGVGMLALAQPAEGKIVYTKTNVGINSGSRLYKLDVNRDRHTDFSFSFQSNCHRRCSSTRYQTLRLSPAGLNAVVRSAYPLRQGAWIGRKRQFNGGIQTMVEIMGSCSRTTQGGSSCRTFWKGGDWYNVTHHYLGLKLFIHGKTHYGWARCNVSINSETGIDATLTGYAYETIPNKAIIAGKTHGKDVITLQPGSLGHLARGASGLQAWRQKVQ